MYSPPKPKLPPLPSERSRQVAFKLTNGDANLLVGALHLTADRAESTASRMRGLAPELHKRAARLRRIAAVIDLQAEGAQ